VRIACVGGGPAGLLAATLLRPRHDVTVFERNAPDDTFGFGVVFSQETLDNIAAAEPEAFGRIAARWRKWSAIDVHTHGRVLRSDGHQFAALARVELLGILAGRATEVGADVRFDTPAPPIDRLRRDYDLVVAADGVNSATRSAYPGDLGPNPDRRPAKYVWFGTAKVFADFTFAFVDSPHGLFQAHIYPYADDRSTFIVETAPEVWRAAGLDRVDASTLRPGETDERSLAFCERLFAAYLDGAALIGNNSRWLEFTTVRNQAWSVSGSAQRCPIVLAGDAAHTAHFSVGSGTKMAMEDAIALARALSASDDVEIALKEYEAERRPLVASTQRAAQTSLEWFEGASRYRDLPDERFAFQLLTRSQRVTYDNLKVRDPAFVADLDRWLVRQARAAGEQLADGTPPLFHPYTLRGMRLRNRVVVSPMAQYSCDGDGVPNDWHLVHWGSRAAGGAGLVFTEMTCVSPEGRITPHCCGLWNDEQAAAFTRIVEFVHRKTDARIGLQLGHAGRKASTKTLWEGEDVPLDDGNWPVIAPSALRYKEFNQLPREMTRADMDAVRQCFVASARRGAECGFDILELHFAHGYLLSSFLSPLANRRTDGYGGTLEQRARYPLEIYDAVRAAWPADRPISVRISATDWVDGGFDGDDAVEFAGLLAAHGCDIVDVSTGQVWPDQRPAYGRLYQTPYADRIKQEVGIATITVGAVSSVDDVNTILMAGRADLCALARPHLVDPYWTLNAALDLGYDGPGISWPNQYLSGKTARRREQRP